MVATKTTKEIINEAIDKRLVSIGKYFPKEQHIISCPSTADFLEELWVSLDELQKWIKVFYPVPSDEDSNFSNGIRFVLLHLEAYIYDKNVVAYSSNGELKLKLVDKAPESSNAERLDTRRVVGLKQHSERSNRRGENIQEGESKERGRKSTSLAMPIKKRIIPPKINYI